MGSPSLQTIAGGHDLYPNESELLYVLGALAPYVFCAFLVSQVLIIFQPLICPEHPIEKGGGVVLYLDEPGMWDTQESPLIDNLTGTLAPSFKKALNQLAALLRDEAKMPVSFFVGHESTLLFGCGPSTSPVNGAGASSR
jgi:hypothetical protein